jgi:dolichol-phosphate mannosyltransferase
VVQLGRFCVVGASGYLINLAVYSALLRVGVPYLPAAVCSFAVAFTNNYTWNRLWTFRARQGAITGDGLRYLIVSLCSLGANLLILRALVSLHADKVLAEAMASVLVTPLSFLGSKLWAFARPRAAVAR